MGKMGRTRHLKREMAPKFWPIHRKEFHWAAKPRPGPHRIDLCIPLVVVVRDILGYAKTKKEAKQIISKGKVRVDGKVRRDDLFPAGLMDVISISDIGRNFRAIPSKKGLILHPIDKGEADFKLCRIENKSTLKNGRIQLNLHDGRNLLVQVNDPQNPEENSYGALDVLKIQFEDQTILEHLKLTEEMMTMITGGKNAGKYGRVVSIDESGQERRSSLVTIEDDKGKRYQTTLDYVFLIGDEKSRISLPSMEGA